MRTKRNFDPRGLFGAPFSLHPMGGGAKVYRWCEALSEVFHAVREAKECFSGRSLQHDGYYVTNFPDETTRPLVLSLSHGRFLVGCSDPWNDNQGVVDVSGVFTNEAVAARCADGLAEYYAERCREDDAKFLAEQEIEDRATELALLRAQHSAVFVAIRETPDDKRHFGYDNTMTQVAQRLRKDAHDCIKQIRKVRDNYWAAVPNY